MTNEDLSGPGISLKRILNDNRQISILYAITRIMFRATPYWVVFPSQRDWVNPNLLTNVPSVKSPFQVPHTDTNRDPTR